MGKTQRKQRQKAERALKQQENSNNSRNKRGSRGRKNKGMSDYQLEKALTQPKVQAKTRQTKAEKKKEREYATKGYPQPEIINF